ncbi:MAG: LOG family protein, partial [Clostridia bacterium]
MKICVFGASSPRIDQSYIDAVENLGELIAGRGHSLVFGAGDNGLMGAAARGVTRGGGKILGIIPTFFKED